MNNFGGHSYNIGKNYALPIQWLDSTANAGLFNNGASGLQLQTLVGGIRQYRFDLNDEVWLPAVQLNHDILINCTIHPHIHLVNRLAVGAINYLVKFEFEWAWVNIDGSINSTYSDPKVFDLKNTTALTHKVFEFSTINPLDPAYALESVGGISSCFIARIKRVAEGSGNAYDTNEIFTFGFDVHYRADSLGSNQEYIK